MFTSICLLLFFSSTCCLAKSRNRNVTKKIIGGHDCSIEQYPFMISLRNKKLRHFCGGTLITSDWVLTAAHCTPNKNPDFYTVVAGTSAINKNGIQRRSVEKIIKHPKYNMKKYRNDIALIKLKEHFKIIPHQVSIIALPSFELEGDVRDYCEKAKVIGWGHRDTWHPNNTLEYDFNPILQCVEIPLLTQQECVKMRGKKLKNGVFCAYAKGGGKDSCQGDSGGPLFCDNVQYGVVSNGYGCGLPESPGYYTRVDQYIKFIRSTLDEDPPTVRGAPEEEQDLIEESSATSIDCSFVLMFVLFSICTY